jgi:hypothetical protein
MKGKEKMVGGGESNEAGMDADINWGTSTLEDFESDLRKMRLPSFKQPDQGMPMPSSMAMVPAGGSKVKQEEFEDLLGQLLPADDQPLLPNPLNFDQQPATSMQAQPLSLMSTHAHPQMFFPDMPLSSGQLLPLSNHEQSLDPNNYSTGYRQATEASMRMQNGLESNGHGQNFTPYSNPLGAPLNHAADPDIPSRQPADVSEPFADLHDLMAEWTFPDSPFNI